MLVFVAEGEALDCSSRKKDATAGPGDWIWENFAPEHRHKDGKAPWWFETDVACWFDEQLEGRRA